MSHVKFTAHSRWVDNVAAEFKLFYNREVREDLTVIGG